MLCQAEQCASLSSVSRLTTENVAVTAGKRSRSVSIDVGPESVTNCTQGIHLMKIRATEMDVGCEAAPATAFSIYCDAATTQKVDTGKTAKQLNATMSHAIDTTSYPLSSEPDEDQMNASIAIDPSNPFDDDMIRKLLSKLSEPLSTYRNYHQMNHTMPKICTRGSIQLGQSEIYLAILFCSDNN